MLTFIPSVPPALQKTSASLNFSDPCNGETPSTSFTGTYFLKNQGRSDLQAALLVVISSAFCSLCFISISINHRREGEGSHTRKIFRHFSQSIRMLPGTLIPTAPLQSPQSHFFPARGSFGLAPFPTSDPHALGQRHHSESCSPERVKNFAACF